MITTKALFASCGETPPEMPYQTTVYIIVDGNGVKKRKVVHANNSAYDPLYGEGAGARVVEVITNPE